jgi:LDH2 family malate/lactate/ureidoglycolate dehydrogenase
VAQHESHYRMSTQLLSFSEVETLALRALVASQVGPGNAAHVARSIASAERDGQAPVGLSYLPTYCDHAACGKVGGFATPVLQQLAPAAIRVDAGTGFAHPALALGVPALAAAARANGVAVLSVGNAYACASLGYFVEQLAQDGLVALMTANASPSMAPWGSSQPFFGINPLAFAAPRDGGPTHCGQLLGVAQFSAALEAMLLAMQETPAVRLPGDRRLQNRAQNRDAITVPSELVALLTRYGGQGSPLVEP